MRYKLIAAALSLTLTIKFRNSHYIKENLKYYPKEALQMLHRIVGKNRKFLYRNHQARFQAYFKIRPVLIRATHYISNIRQLQKISTIITNPTSFSKLKILHLNHLRRIS